MEGIKKNEIWGNINCNFYKYRGRNNIGSKVGIISLFYSPHHIFYNLIKIIGLQNISQIFHKISHKYPMEISHKYQNIFY